MSSDGGLRQLEMKHITGAHFQPIETWSTGQGVPDVNVCINGIESWIENKLTHAWAVDFDAMQISWIERRIRNSGRVFVAVRRKTTSGPRKGKAVDELHVFHGRDVRRVAIDGICKGTEPWSLLICKGGPAAWDWAGFKAILCDAK